MVKLNVYISGEDIVEIGYSKGQTTLGKMVEDPHSDICMVRASTDITKYSGNILFLDGAPANIGMGGESFGVDKDTRLSPSDRPLGYAKVQRRAWDQ